MFSLGKLLVIGSRAGILPPLALLLELELFELLPLLLVDERTFCNRSNMPCRNSDIVVVVAA
jgi:hypothetical protein